MDAIGAATSAGAWPPTVVGLLALACLWFAWRSFARARSIADTARSRVRSAPHGYVELYGRALAGVSEAKPRRAPLTGRSCAWWAFRIERQSGSRRGWSLVDSGRCDEPFILDDGTGTCRVDPRDAEIKAAVRQVWYGSESWPPGPPLTTTLGFLGAQYRYTEQRIHEGDDVCVLGEFATVGSIADGSDEDEIAAVLHEWKADQSSLLKRFDRNGDGQLDAEEWDQARAAARESVHAQVAAAPAVHQIARPRDGRPFLLAARDPVQLARTYRWQAAAGLAGFFGALIFLTRVLRS